MKKEMLLVVEAVSNEKDVPKEVIFEAMEAALASAIRKKLGAEADIRVAIDRTTGEYQVFRRWEVVEDEACTLPERQRPLSEAQKQDANLTPGAWIEEPLRVELGGRITAQAAKQVIVQRVREAERAKIVEAYRARKGELVTGVVKRVERGNVFLDLGDNAEALIPRSQVIPGESVRPGDRLRGYLFEVRPEPKGPQLFVSRTAPELMIELFKLEVPEVGEGLIEILGAVRDPGARRAKIAVRTKDKRIDPVGACVGMRGSRVQAVSNELNREQVDIILWNENPALFVINAMSPAEVVSIVIDEEAHSMDVVVKEESLRKAIGANGQNVRLASQLTGWTLNVMSEAEAAEKQARENRKLVNYFMDQLGVDEEIGTILVEAGFSTIDEVAYVPREELLAIEEFDEGLVNQLRDLAKDVLLTRAIASEEELERAEPRVFGDLEGMDAALEAKLRQQGINTLEALAEQSVDELVEQTGIGEALAAKLIMQAREPWFAQAAQQSPPAAKSRAVPQALGDLKGMDAALEAKLRQQGINTLEALAEQSVDELVEQTGIEKALAAQLIMQAREPWFAQAENE